MILEEAVAIGGGTFKLAMNITPRIDYYDQNGEYSHIVAVGDKEYVDYVWENIKNGYQYVW